MIKNKDLEPWIGQIKFIQDNGKTIFLMAMANKFG